MAAMELQANGNGILPGEVTTPANVNRRGGWFTFPFISVNVMGLTLASVGWTGNLTVYLIQQFSISSIDAAQIWNVVNGCTNLFPVAGAIIADSFLGNFSVISVSSLVSLLGVILFMLTGVTDSLRPPHCDQNSSSCEQSPSRVQFAVLYSAIALASVGLGGTRFTIATMGADQFEEPKNQGVFFNWYFFTLYLASTIGSTAIVYVEDNVGWGWGFGLCVATNAIGLVIFLVGKKYYRHVKPQGSPFTSLARVVVAAIRKRKMSVLSSSDYYYDHEELNGTDLKRSAPTSSFRFLNCAALRIQSDTHQDGSIAKPWRLCTVQEVEGLKTLIKLFPLWSSSIFLSISIAIINSLVVLQALSMDRHIGAHFKVPSGSFLVFTLIFTAISIPIIDRFLFPITHKLINKTPTPLQRIGFGHILNIIGMAMSALVESRRLRVARSHQPIGSHVPMSALWLVAPLAIIGVGEAFHFPGQVELYYHEFPKSLRSTSTAMIALLVGIGYYLSTAVVGLVREVTNWLPNDINNGRLDNVFWMLAVIDVINFGYYLTCSIMYKYQNIDEKPEEL